MRFLLAFLVLCASLATAADAPTLSSDDTLAIREAQLKQAELIIQLGNLRDQYNTVNGQLAEQQTKTRALIIAASARAKATDAFTLDETTLKFVAKTKAEAKK